MAKPVTLREQRNFRIIALTYCSVAIVWTIFRLYLRRRGLWWDDFFVCAALLSFVGQTVVIVYVTYGVLLAPPGSPLAPKVALVYLNAITYVLTDWFARLALLYSIVRITASVRIVKFLYGVAVFFVACALTNIFLFVGWCETHDLWKQGPFVLCIQHRSVPIMQIITGILSDAILIFLPINTVRMLTSAPAMRRRLVIIFSASSVLTIAQIIQAVLTFRSPGVATLVSSMTEAFVAVTVASLAIVSTGLMQLLGINTSGKEKKPTIKTDKYQFESSLEFRTSYTDEGITTSKQIADQLMNDSSSVLPSSGTDPATGDKTDSKDTKPSTEPSLYPPTSPRVDAIRNSQAMRSTPTTSLAERWRNINVDEDLDDLRSNRRGEAA